MNTYNTEDVKTWSKISRKKSSDELVLKYIDLVEARASHTCDMVHALKVYAEGKVDEASFKHRMKDLTHSCHPGILRKIVCPVCKRYFWTSQPTSIYCSRKCLKVVERSKEKLQKSS